MNKKSVRQISTRSDSDAAGLSAVKTVNGLNRPLTIMLLKTLSKSSLFLLLLLVLLVAASSAQTKEARPLDNFTNAVCDDYLARIDNLTVEAENEPTSTVYVLVYEGKASIYNSRTQKYESKLPTFGSAKAKIASMKKYLSGVRKIPLDNFRSIEAGFRDNSTVEFWLVPPGAEPPKPAPTLTKIKYRKGKAIGFCLYCCG